MRGSLVLALAAACAPSSSAIEPDGGGGGTTIDGGAEPDGPKVPPGPRLIPGPGKPGHDAALAAKAHAYDRQFHTFSAMPFGLSLDALIPDPADRALVDGFLAQSATDDFAQFTGGRTVHDIVVEYDEHGDLGMFAGAAAAGEAFRYIALRDANSPDAARARADLLEAIESFHVAATIVGVPGAVARGVRRLDEPGPVPTVEPVPTSCPQSGDRGRNVWRADGSGLYPGWIYNDNNSKDQLLGYVFALGAFWDAIADDNAIPQSVRTQLQADALALARSLMKPVSLGFSGSVDLIVTDWRGCPTRHLDLNPRVVPISGYDPLVLGASATTQNGWNALAALGVMRTLYHISGDAAVGHYYYDELVAVRDYPKLAISGPAHVGAMYQDGSNSTNFSNVNMAFVAAYGVLRYETEPGLRGKYEAILESELWNANHPHDGESIQQALFNVMYAGFRAGGNHSGTTVGAVAQLAEFSAPPYWDYVVENCDADEVAAGSCIAIDGTTPIALAAPGSTTAQAPLPKRLRPPSNFEWRSEPRSVNGGGGIRLNPGGDFRVAYWLGRALLDAPTGQANLSPVAIGMP